MYNGEITNSRKRRERKNSTEAFIMSEIINQEQGTVRETERESYMRGDYLSFYHGEIISQKQGTVKQRKREKKIVKEREREGERSI